MAALAAMIRGTVPPPTPPAEQQPMEAEMEVTKQGDNVTLEKTEVQQSGSTEPAMKDVSNA